MKKEIREFEKQDLDACYEIYRYYVLNSVWNLDLKPDSREAFLKSIQDNPDFPFLVAVVDDQVIGYATAHHYRPKDGYQHAAELTLYFREGPHFGLASQIADALSSVLKRQNVRLEIGCITASNERSVAMNRRRGFEEYGRLKEAAWKNGAYHDVLWMKRSLQEPDFDPAEELLPRFIPWSELKKISPLEKELSNPAKS